MSSLAPLGYLLTGAIKGLDLQKSKNPVFGHIFEKKYIYICCRITCDSNAKPHNLLTGHFFMKTQHYSVADGIWLRHLTDNDKIHWHLILVLLTYVQNHEKNGRLHFICKWCKLCSWPYLVFSPNNVLLFTQHGLQ